MKTKRLASDWELNLNFMMVYSSSSRVRYMELGFQQREVGDDKLLVRLNRLSEPGGFEAQCVDQMQFGRIWSEVDGVR